MSFPTCLLSYIHWKINSLHTNTEEPVLCCTCIYQVQWWPEGTVRSDLMWKSSQISGFFWVTNCFSQLYGEITSCATDTLARPQPIAASIPQMRYLILHYDFCFIFWEDSEQSVFKNWATYYQLDIALKFYFLFQGLSEAWKWIFLFKLMFFTWKTWYFPSLQKPLWLCLPFLPSCLALLTSLSELSLSRPSGIW